MLAELSSFHAVNLPYYEAWINNDVSTGSLSGYEKADYVSNFVLSGNGRETKTHRTKDQQTNIIGSHTVSDTKYFFSQHEKRKFAPSGSSLATDELEFLR